jgi:hypothetical protein
MSPLFDRLVVLSEPIRVRLLRVLSREELAVGELARVLQTSQPTVSRHLKLLDGGARWARSGAGGLAPNEGDGKYLANNVAAEDDFGPRRNPGGGYTGYVQPRMPQVCHQCQGSVTSVLGFFFMLERSLVTHVRTAGPHWGCQPVHGPAAPRAVQILKSDLYSEFNVVSILGL